MAVSRRPGDEIPPWLPNDDLRLNPVARLQLSQRVVG